jgi:hypothetical protein
MGVVARSPSEESFHQTRHCRDTACIAGGNGNIMRECLCKTGWPGEAGLLARAQGGDLVSRIAGAVQNARRRLAINRLA